LSIDAASGRVASIAQVFVFARERRPFYRGSVVHRIWLSMLCGALSAALPAAALAQTSGTTGQGNASSARNAEPEADEDVEKEGLGPARDAASDQRTMHLLVHGRGGAAFPAGSVATGIGTAEVSGAGFGFGGGIGLGLSRYLVLEVNAGYALLGGEDTYDIASGRTFDIGIGFAYHLAQGIAFDPWISYGVGFRTATFVTDEDADDQGQKSLPGPSFQGLDVARFALGGDFYPLPTLGFGPYFEVDVGTTITRPGALPSSVYAFLHLGVRIAFDPMSKAPPRANASAAGREAAGFGGLAPSF
jgi:hypothetical protein